MAAIQNVSQEFYDHDALRADLLEGVAAFGGGIGFLVLDASLEDYPALVSSLSAAVDFPVVGCTTLAFPLMEDRDEVSASFCVFKAEGFECSVAVSEVLNLEDRTAQMTQLYNACAGGLAGGAKLFYTALPYMPKLASEGFAGQLFEKAGPLPLVGGIASSDIDNDVAAVFCGGACYTDRIVLAALGGGIQPAFAVGAQLTAMSAYAPAVTKSEGNVVYTVDGLPFARYLEEVGIVTDASIQGMEKVFQYGPLPALLSGKQPEGDDVPEIRVIVSIDPKDGSGVFSSAVPVGTRITMGTLRREDISESSGRAAALLKQRAAAQAGYRHSLLLNVSCVARYFTMAGGADVESAAVRSQLPEGLCHSSYYSFCEIGPVPITGGLHNRTFAESNVLCAI